MGFAGGCCDKKNQDIRLVIDCKVSINKVIVPNSYPLPLAQDLFATLAGSKVFCSLDLTGAYTQLLLSKRSRKFMIINTIKGLYAYNRLPQGASSSASIFQKVMDQVLQDLENVSVYLDDVLIAGKDYEDCKRKLYLVLERLAKANIKVNFNKCKFFVTELPYLGHVLTEKGLRPCPEKIETIRVAKAPQNVSELKAFLGLVTYYAKFIPNLSGRIKCLYALLKKNTKYNWDFECEKVFNECKQFLLKPNLLEYYDPEKPVVIVTDACSYGLGGVMAHVVRGEERPVSFTSFTLNDAQRKYPILHLEALAVVSTVKKFHKFLYGKKFTIYTDHKPLIGIFGKEGKNALSVTRLQRYVMELSIYDYDIVYRQSSRMGNADFCSRFPIAQEVPYELSREYIKSLNFTDEFPLDYKEVANETKKDKYLLKILEFLNKGWPSRIDRQFLDIYSHHQDLEEVDGCVLFQDRVVIPETMKLKVLKMLHMNHAGMNKIKQLARRTVYWFGMNNDIEKFVKSCRTCNETTLISRKPPYSQWIPTKKPFSRIHADFFHFDKKVFLIVVDSFTKWIEIEHMKYGTDHKKVIKVFLNIFARFGLPDVLVTDGGPPFNSDIFAKFFRNQGIVVLKSPPYHPESNGQAERMVRLIKDVFKKFVIDPEIRKLNTEEQLSYFLINYRNICLKTDGKSPAEKMLSYKPKVLIDLINPKSDFRYNLTESHDDRLKRNVSNSPGKTTDQFTNLKNGDLIYYKNNNPTDIRQWLPAKFLKRTSTNILQVSLGGRIVSAHKRQLKLGPASRRKRSKVFAFQGESAVLPYQNPLMSEESAKDFVSIPEDTHTRKRRREDDSDDSDGSSDFYGFPADSFIFSGEDTRTVGIEHDWQPAQEIRRSKRTCVKKKRSDFVYY